MRSSNPRSDYGFTVVEIVVALCVVGIVAAVGFVWWRGSDEVSITSSPNQSSASASVQSSPAPTPNSTADWKTFTQKDGYYSFKYPASWTITGDIDGTRFDGLEYIELQDGGAIVATVTRYLDGTGCPDDPTKEHEAYIGAKKVTATAYCGSTRYKAMATVDNLPKNDKSSGSQVQVEYVFGASQDAELVLFGKSLTGISSVN